MCDLLLEHTHACLLLAEQREGAAFSVVPPFPEEWGPRGRVRTPCLSPQSWPVGKDWRRPIPRRSAFGGVRLLLNESLDASAWPLAIRFCSALITKAGFDSCLVFSFWLRKHHVQSALLPQTPRNLASTAARPAGPLPAPSFMSFMAEGKAVFIMGVSPDLCQLPQA